MNKKEKAVELVEKFGIKSIDVVQEIISYVTKGEPDWSGETIELQELQNEIRILLLDMSDEHGVFNPHTINLYK